MNTNLLHIHNWALASSTLFAMPASNAKNILYKVVPVATSLSASSHQLPIYNSIKHSTDARYLPMQCYNKTTQSSVHRMLLASKEHSVCTVKNYASSSWTHVRQPLLGCLIKHGTECSHNRPEQRYNETHVWNIANAVTIIAHHNSLPGQMWRRAMARCSRTEWWRQKWAWAPHTFNLCP